MKKNCSESVVIMTELVLPHHTNHIGTLLGGQLMHWIDICAAMAAGRHAGNVCVTASVDKIDFHYSARLGDIVTLLASVNRAFNTSMEVGVKVYSENIKTGKKIHTNSAYLTFVSVDENLKPSKTNELIPQTEEEKRRYENAFLRRKNRLLNNNSVSSA